MLTRTYPVPRALIDWSQDQLAQKAERQLFSVKDFERGGLTPVPETLNALQAALESGGAEFVHVAAGGTEVRRKDWRT
jgi:ribosome-binding protein aMBF1 (putative translation factor)